MAKRRVRLNRHLVDLGFFQDEREALGPIMAGDVLVNDAPVTKAGALVNADADIRIRGMEARFASRGGYKLEHALDAFGIEVSGRTVLDAGASTGGFTDCLLQRGARRVYAVDVGYGQLRGRLAADERVVVLEKTNISDLIGGGLIDEPVQLCTADLSYLSLAKALPDLREALGPVEMVCLVKPLYEGLKEENKADEAAIGKVVDDLAGRLESAGFRVAGIVPSPIPGGRGAIECLMHIRGDA